jgi:hypothetical protein
LTVATPEHPFLDWWALTRRAVQTLTSPPADVARCDREVEQLARASWLGSLGRRSAEVIGDSWRHSKSGVAASALVDVLKPAAAAAAVRVAGWTAIVASMTTLALNTMRPASSGPFTWVVPAIVGVAGVLAMVLSGSTRS